MKKATHLHASMFPSTLLKSQIEGEKFFFCNEINNLNKDTNKVQKVSWFASLQLNCDQYQVPDTNSSIRSTPYGNYIHKLSIKG